VNATGGLSGHQVQVISKDDQANPGNGITDAKALVSANVVALVDISDVDQVWLKSVETAGIPIIPGPQSLYTGSDAYPVGQTQGPSIVGSMIAVAKQAGLKNFGYLYCAEVPACAANLAATETQGAKAGVPVIYKAAISLAGTDFTSQCLAAEQAHAASLVVATTPSGTETVATDCSRQGYQPAYIVLGSQWSQSMGSQAGLKDNTWLPYPTLPYFATNPAITAMNTALDKYYPGIRTAPTTAPADLVEEWAAGLLIQDAVKAANTETGGTVTAAQLVTGLQALHGDTLRGLTTPLTYPAGQDHPLNCWFTVHYANGTPAVLDGGQPTCLS
jgi:branched-chain amino acid transport system substrate-binding protein